MGRLSPGRRLALLAILLGALLAIVALASRAYRPLGGAGDRGGVSNTFYDYFFTIAAILWLVGGGVVVVFVLLGQGRRDTSSMRIRLRLPGILLIVATVLALVWGRDAIRRLRGEDRGAEQAPAATVTTPTGTTRVPRRPREPEFQWPVAIIVGGVLLATVAVVAGRGLRRRDALEDELLAAALADALDDTLDDLRREADPRRAVIAAYARMERLLGAYGVRREAAEAPHEYLRRVLLALRAGADAVAALTGFFELAKFSEHEIGLEQKDDAIAALVEIRDGLRGEP